MKSIKFLFFVIQLILISCSKPTPSVNVSMSAIGEFPIITFSNLAGKNIDIAPISEDKGSIGFGKDSTVYWVKGEPEIKTDETGETLYKFPWYGVCADPLWDLFDGKPDG